ncbi:unnamed protein product [Absidia cylindrospora]
MFFLNKQSTTQQPLDKLKDWLLEQNQISQDQLDKISNKLDGILEAGEQQQQQTELLFQRLASLEHQTKHQSPTERDISHLDITAPTAPAIGQNDSPTTVPTVRDIPHPVNSTGKQLALPLHKSDILKVLQTIQGKRHVNQEYFALFDTANSVIKELKANCPDQLYKQWREVSHEVKISMYDTMESRLRTIYGINIDRAEDYWVAQSMVMLRWKSRFNTVSRLVPTKVEPQEKATAVTKNNDSPTNPSSSSSSSSTSIKKTTEVKTEVNDSSPLSSSSSTVKKIPVVVPEVNGSSSTVKKIPVMVPEDNDPPTNSSSPTVRRTPLVVTQVNNSSTKSSSLPSTMKRTPVVIPEDSDSLSDSSSLSSSPASTITAPGSPSFYVDLSCASPEHVTSSSSQKRSEETGKMNGNVLKKQRLQ